MTNATSKRKRAVPLHQQILNDIVENILSGKWPPGYRIPTERDLMGQYRCSRMTVSKAITHLAGMKLIERRRRAGSFVARPHSSSAVLEISDIKAEVEDLGLSYSYEMLSRRKKAIGPGERELLEVRKGSRILKLVACHYANGCPFCLEERLISLVAVPEAAEEAFKDLPPGSWLMSRVPWNLAEHRIRAVSVAAATAQKLDISPGSAGLVVERRTWGASRAVTYVRLTYPADAHELVARFSRSNATIINPWRRESE